jgi:hypothetical protein
MSTHKQAKLINAIEIKEDEDKSQMCEGIESIKAKNEM